MSFSHRCVLTMKCFHWSIDDANWQRLGIFTSPTSAVARSSDIDAEMTCVIDMLRLLVSVALEGEVEMSLPQESAEMIGAVSKHNHSDTRRVHAVRAAQSLFEAIGSETHTLLARVDGTSIGLTVWPICIPYFLD